MADRLAGMTATDADLAEIREQIRQLKARYFRTMDTKDWDGFAAVPDEYLDAGDTVVVLGRYHGTYNIKVVNLSLGGSTPGSLLMSSMPRPGPTTRARTTAGCAADFTPSETGRNGIMPTRKPRAHAPYPARLTP